MSLPPAVSQSPMNWSNSCRLIKCSNTSRQRTTSNECLGIGSNCGHSRSPLITFLQYLRATFVAAGSFSTPITIHDFLRSSRAMYPVAQPISSTRLPGGTKSMASRCTSYGRGLSCIYVMFFLSSSTQR